MQRFTNRFFLISALSLMVMMAGAQQPIKNYEAQWKKVADLIKKQLPQSAVVELKKIYTMAKKEGQDAQVIKSLVAILNIQDQNRDDQETTSITELEKEIKTSKQPATAILQSILATYYYNYYQQNRWNLYQRTKTVGFKKEDVATWTIDDFHKKISQLFLESISNEKLLQQTKLESFDAIIVKGNMRHLRPTLYDLLANTALEYFENDERDLRKPDPVHLDEPGPAFYEKRSQAA